MCLRGEPRQPKECALRDRSKGWTSGVGCLNECVFVAETEFTLYHVHTSPLQVIPRTPSLDNLTRDRPKPPSQRRAPSKYRTPTPSPSPSPLPSPTHTTAQPSSPSFQPHPPNGHTTVERIGGITDMVQQEDANGGQGSKNGDEEAKTDQSIREQWVNKVDTFLG